MCCKNDVISYRSSHPYSRKEHCARDLGIDIRTVSRWWSYKPKPKKRERDHVQYKIDYMSRIAHAPIICALSLDDDYLVELHVVARPDLYGIFSADKNGSLRCIETMHFDDRQSAIDHFKGRYLSSEWIIEGESDHGLIYSGEGSRSSWLVAVEHIEALARHDRFGSSLGG